MDLTGGFGYKGSMRALDTPEAKLIGALFGDREGHRVAGEKSVEFTIKDTNCGLCGSCANAQIIRFASGRDQTYCKVFYIEKEILGAVEECNQYHRINAQSLGDMKHIAWYVETEDGKVVGFLKPGSEKHKRMRNSD